MLQVFSHCTCVCVHVKLWFCCFCVAWKHLWWWTCVWTDRWAAAFTASLHSETGISCSLRSRRLLLSVKTFMKSQRVSTHPRPAAGRQLLPSVIFKVSLHLMWGTRWVRLRHDETPAWDRKQQKIRRDQIRHQAVKSELQVSSRCSETSQQTPVGLRSAV